MIIDAQAHVWPASTPERPWRSGRDASNVHLPTPFRYEDLLREMDRLHIDRAILVPPGWEGDRVDYVLEAARKHPDRLAAFGRISVEKPASRALLNRWLDQAGMRGVRLSFQHEHNRHFMMDGTVEWFWPEAERLGIPIMLYAPHFLRRVGEIAMQYPRLKIILDHFGLFRQKDEEACAAMSDVARLATYPNISVKVTSAPYYTTQPFPFRNLHAALRDFIAAFGAHRCFWGSDVTRLMQKNRTYEECLHLFTRELELLADEREWVLGRGLSEFLDWR